MLMRISAIALLCAVMSSPVFAADDAMQACVAMAQEEGLSGEDRQDFIADCLAEAAAAAKD